MKRLISLILSISIITGLICGLSITSAYAASPIRNIYINGVPLEFSEAERPFIIGDRTMVPLRVIAEGLGATVYWFNDDKKIQIVRYDTTLRMFIGLPGLDIYKIEYDEETGMQDQAKIDTIDLEEATPFQGDESRDYRTFVPIRAISEAFGADVNAEFADNDEGAIDRAINVYILDDYDTANENYVSIASLYDNSDIEESTLISTIGIITKIDSNYYLQDENETYKMISLTEIPDVEDFWTQQLGVANNNPVGTTVKITGMVAKDDDRYSMQLKRGSTGIRAVSLPSSSGKNASITERDNTETDDTGIYNTETDNLFFD